VFAEKAEIVADRVPGFDLLFGGGTGVAATLELGLDRPQLFSSRIFSSMARLPFEAKHAVPSLFSWFATWSRTAMW
jgi:hypothetical protein